ncbi:hypothetical protein BRD56_05785 [Thermoplasmatales archaeon SW_10_69_26]|nr:MAG: hypothetical protein BRD56_05785 [Thermoplasmatales archaeon SW_10_69_26]
MISGQSPTEFLDLPENWKARRVRTFLEKVDDRTEESDAPLLSVSKYTGIRPREEVDRDREFRADSTEGYKIVEPGDLVVNIMLAWDGAVGFSEHEGVVSPSYEIYRLTGQGDMTYFHYLFRSELYQYEFARHSTGIRRSRWRLYKSDFFPIEVLYPPLEQQSRIASFLDHHTARIDRLVEKKQRLLELLEEKRQAVITEAVTRGLRRADTKLALAQNPRLASDPTRPSRN